MKFTQALLVTAALSLLLLGDTAAAATKKSKRVKPKKDSKRVKSKGENIIGEAEVFLDSYDFMKNDSPESIVFDSKGNAYVSLTLNAFVSVINPEGEEIGRIEFPQGYCRPAAPTEISFPLSSLQFGLAMSKDDTLYVSLLACAEGFPQPPNPNPNTGLWMVNTEDYSIKQVARIPNANGRGRQDFCCEWNEEHHSEASPPYIGKLPDGTCDLEECAFYEAWYGSALFPNIDQFKGYAELWNGLEVVGDCVYITNSYFHEIWRTCPPEEDDGEDMWEVEVWMERGTSPHLDRLPGTFFTTAGFNGIKYFEEAFYVANTSQRKLVKVPLLPADTGRRVLKKKTKKQETIHSIIKYTGGRGVVPGTPELIFEGGDVDEFTISKNGNIYAALFEDNKVIKISSNGTSEVILDGGETYGSNCPQFGNGEYVEDYDPLPTIDMPTSVAFGTTNGNDMTLYVANSAFIFFKSCAGFPILKPDGSYTYYPGYPGVSRISVGEEGAKQIW
jgi:hypothetical protein